MSVIKIDKIEKIDSRIQQLLNEKKRLLNQHKEFERKTRTKRLIERGAILESLVTNLNELSNEQIKRFLETTVTTEYADRMFINARSWNPELSKPVKPMPEQERKHNSQITFDFD